MRVKGIKYFIWILFIATVLWGCKPQNKRWLVISKIKSTAELATTETIIDKVVIGNKQKKAFGLVKVSHSNFVAYTEATVLTGIDLTQLKKRDVRINKNSIEVDLPPVKVIDFKYPFNKFRIDKHLSNQKFLSSVDVIDMESFYRKAENDIRKNLPYMGIIEQTEQNTRKLMEGLLTNLGYHEIYISFKNDSTRFIPEINWKKYLNSDN